MARGKETVRSKGERVVFDNDSNYEDHHEAFAAIDKALHEPSFDEEMRAYDHTVQILHRKTNRGFCWEITCCSWVGYLVLEIHQNYCLLVLPDCNKEWPSWRDDSSAQCGHQVSRHAHRFLQAPLMYAMEPQRALLQKVLFSLHITQKYACMLGQLSQCYWLYICECKTFTQRYKLFYMVGCIRKHLSEEICNVECCEQLYVNYDLQHPMNVDL